MRAAAVLALALIGPAACSPPAEKAAAPAAPAGPAAATGPEWVFGMGKNSVELTRLIGGKADDPELRLICARGEGFTLLAPKVTAVGSEERLSLGADGAVVALVATTAKAGVKAAGPIDGDLLAILSGKAPLSLSYGATNAGPFAPPDAARRAFAETCRKLQLSGQV